MKHAQQQKLRLLLDHAREFTTYYASRIPDSLDITRLDPRTVLEGVMPLSRQDLQREKVRLLSASGDMRGWRTVRSSGTTGEPIEVVLDEHFQALEEVVLRQHIDRCLCPGSWNCADLIHVTLNPSASSWATPSPWNPGAVAVKWDIARAWQGSDSQLFESLRHLSGTVVTMMPSVAELLARRMLGTTGMEQVRPLLIILSGERLELYIRRMIEVAFGCPVTSLYTLAEAGIIGTACLNGVGYHIEEGAAFVEILDDLGHTQSMDQEGEVVVTPLENLAMPLLRYRTGDRAMWISEPCTCTNRSPRLMLTQVRNPTHIVTPTGATVNVVRFAKVLGRLDVERFVIRQLKNGTVIVDYRAKNPIDNGRRFLIEGAFRAVLGPDAEVKIQRVSCFDHSTENSTSRSTSTISTPSPNDEPAGLDSKSIAGWLRLAFEGDIDIEAAVLTGSFLDTASTSRFSDIDLVILLREGVEQTSWIERVNDLRQRVPSLAISLDHASGLATRAPLLTCRLLREQLPVSGRLHAVLSWPTVEQLATNSRFWAQQTMAHLWQKLSGTDRIVADPVRECWLLSKLALDALRYRYLLRGWTETASRAVLARAQEDPEVNSVYLPDVTYAIQVGREHRPPPPVGSDALRRSMFGVFCSVRDLLR